MAGPQTKELGDREHRAISNGVYLLIPYRQYRSVLSLAFASAFVCHCIFSGASAPPRYARTSTVEQRAGFEAQMRELAAAGCEKTFQEQVSSVANRIQLHTALEFVREGDILVVTRSAINAAWSRIAQMIGFATNPAVLVYLVPCIAKRYCISDPIGDTFMQC